MPDEDEFPYVIAARLRDPLLQRLDLDGLGVRLDAWR